MCGIRRHDFKPTKAKHRSFAGIHFELGCYTRLSLGVLHPHSSESDLQEKLTFGERIRGATIHAKIFSIMSNIRVEWQSKWARVEKYGRLLILFILFYLMNYITYYFSRKPVGPAPLVFHKPTDSPNAVCCVQIRSIHRTSIDFTDFSLCPLMHFASFPTKVNYMYDASIGNNFFNSTNSWHNVVSFSVKENSS